MLGTIITTARDQATIHTYISPDDGLNATTHIVELTTQLIIIDTQYAAPYADEAAEYARGLEKPISRVYVSHDHPDHFFGAAAFDAPVYALASTRETIAAAGAQMLASSQASAGSFVPTSLAVPSETVTPGEETIDGVRFVFRAIEDTEAAAMLAIALPDLSVLIAQDLVYNNLHLYLVEGRFEGWRRALRHLQSEGWATVLPGHGAPGGPELFDAVLTYLAASEPIIGAATGADQLKDALVDAFPDAGGVALLDIQNRYLFPTA